MCAPAVSSSESNTPTSGKVKLMPKMWLNVFLKALELRAGPLKAWVGVG